MAIVDNWLLRRWIVWPWCALRRHPDTFYLHRRLNGETFATVIKCSCGRRTRQGSTPW